MAAQPAPPVQSVKIRGAPRPQGSYQEKRIVVRRSKYLQRVDYVANQITRKGYKVEWAQDGDGVEFYIPENKMDEVLPVVERWLKGKVFTATEGELPRFSKYLNKRGITPNKHPDKNEFWWMDMPEREGIYNRLRKPLDEQAYNALLRHYLPDLRWEAPYVSRETAVAKHAKVSQQLKIRGDTEAARKHISVAIGLIFPDALELLAGESPLVECSDCSAIAIKDDRFCTACGEKFE